MVECLGLKIPFLKTKKKEKEKRFDSRSPLQHRVKVSV